MSHEGVVLVTRIALVSAAIIVTAIARVVVGPGRKRGAIMMVGIVGGVAFGLLGATYVVSPMLKTDAPAICVLLGVPLGWAVSWRFARRIPRGAN